mmetsp:Transcript_18496/g.47609  ORF Transcript_18496/g.47609 Transcript_18496/m.47609 type:complete len:83 (+) Transcript_18496:428-676(+)|eukprot:CAMPEP_0119432156 /NCGR_PEP_ID=MMETSP1335-20130426/47277_1 /TAXON_ID=259385 /ORGANISM="Chrysoculter rhomboideus, Strain RCC1486" /LENGTH=82 /DNA_ID=CAMNT_0007457973 /DNA_START=282 /DNA_END=530 /DNA_ORIENTATION=-
MTLPEWVAHAALFHDRAYVAACGHSRHARAQRRAVLQKYEAMKFLAQLIDQSEGAKLTIIVIKAMDSGRVSGVVDDLPYIPG